MTLYRIIDDFRSNHEMQWTGKLEKGGGAFPDGRPSGKAAGKIMADVPAGSWAGCNSLQFTIYNPWDRPAEGGIEIFDRTALQSPELEYGDYVERKKSLLLGEGVTHVIIQINPIQTTQGTRNLDLGNVAEIAILLPEPEEGQESMSVSELRLSCESQEPDAAANPQPGDSVLIMKHLDISCFTYRPEEYKEPEEIAALQEELLSMRRKLQTAINAAEINGKQTHYAHAALVAVDIALFSRPLLAWHFLPRAKRDNLEGAMALVREQYEKLTSFLSSRCHEDDEDDSNLSMSLVKPVPVLEKLRIQGKGFVDESGRRALVCAMSYHNEGALMRFFSPEKHKLEIFAVGGGSRYDIEWSPVYEAFHREEGTKRIGWRGWCGHLIKDQWAMGGRKENVVLCLENEKILEAIDQYNRIHAEEWIHNKSLLYIILGYELTYMCYCDESLRRFRLWLMERHGDIGALNRKWDTAYSSFDEAVPPATEGWGPVHGSNRAAWFDWADWNMRRFTDHLKWSRESVRKLHSGIPICAGGTHSMLNPSCGTSGIDEELIINEIDDVILHEGRDIVGVDLLGALSEGEKPMVDPEQGGDCTGWIHNYLHGKSTIAMFWWPKQPSRQFPSSTLAAPLQGSMSIKRVAEHLTTALDIRRLSEEITAFWDIPKEVAVLYSRTSMIQIDPGLVVADKTPYIESMRMTYDAARCLDAGTTFISERQLLKGKAESFKVIIVPSVSNLPEKVFKALDEYVLSGGNVVVIPEALINDEYNHPAGYLKKWGIVVIGSHKLRIEGFGGMEQRYDQNMQRKISFDKGVRITAARYEAGFDGLGIALSGVFQDISIEGGTTVAGGPGGEALLAQIPRGSGFIWYFAGTPEASSLAAFLDMLYARTGVERHLKVTDEEGKRVLGLEARLVRRKFDDLVYIVNGSGRDVAFCIDTDRSYYRIRELRSLKYFDLPEGTIEKDGTLLFSMQEDPVALIKAGMKEKEGSFE